MNLYGDLPPIGTGSQATTALDSKLLVTQSGWSRPNAGRIGQVPRSISMGAATASKSLSSASIASKQKNPIQFAAASVNVTSHQLIPVVSTEVLNQKRQHDGEKTATQSVHNLLNSQNQISNASHGASFDVEDPYDPSRPNDYLLWCEERLEKKRLDKLNEENKQLMAEAERARLDMEKERSEAMVNGDVQRLQVSMGAGRGRGRGLSNLPAWMAQYAEAPSPATIGDVSAGQFDDTDLAVDPSAASRIMSKMGFQQGDGLGKERQGILNPLEHVRGAGTGALGGAAQIMLEEQDRMRIASRLIAAKLALISPDADAPSSSGAAAPRKRLGLFSNPSCVVLLKNMVGPGDVDEMLADECKQECSKYGPVNDCVIFEITTDPDCPAEERVRTFVFFEKQESAVKAYREMNGRFFGGRQIAASFYDEVKFQKRDLGPTATEWTS
jgi:splicing factor 45